MIEGVTITGDLLRPDGRGNPGGADRPVTWLFNAIRRQVALACGLPVSVLTTQARPALAHALTQARSSERAALHWAAGFDRLADRTLFDRHVMPLLRGRFCIGYEMPPWLSAILDDDAIPYIDLRIHPVRFLDDLLFSARAQHPETQAALYGMAVMESEVIATAGLRQAMCQMITASALPANTLLVLGQRPMDSTQIIGGRFFDAYDHQEPIAKLCADYHAVLLKPHPQERAHSLLAVAAGVARNVIGVTNDNLYRLLSLPQIAAVLTVNSSAAYEVPYFGPHLEALAPLPVSLAWSGEAPDRRRHVSVDDRILTPDFWRMVLAPHVRVSRCDGMRLTPKPNRLRIALDSFWNYQEIDTNRVPGPTPGPCAR
jgi:hypothetical protein